MGSVERRSPAYLKSFIEKHPGIRDSVSFTGRLTTVSSMLGRGKPAGLHYLFSLVDEAEANAYFSDLERHLPQHHGPGLPAPAKADSEYVDARQDEPNHDNCDGHQVLELPNPRQAPYAPAILKYWLIPCH